MAQISIVTTCKGRLSYLKQTLPHNVAQKDCEVVVVDYNCPDKAGDWVEQNFPQVKVVRVPVDAGAWNTSSARNRGIEALSTPYFCAVDADVRLHPDWAETVLPQLSPHSYLTTTGTSLGGFIVAPADVVKKIGGYDEVITCWGDEDTDLSRRLNSMMKLTNVKLPSNLFYAFEHGNEIRCSFVNEKNIDRGYMANIAYDLLKLAACAATRELILPLNFRKGLYQQVWNAVTTLFDGKESSVLLEIELPSVELPECQTVRRKTFLRLRRP